MLNNFSNKAYAWLMGTLLSALVILVLLIQHAQDINALALWLKWGVIVLGVLLALYIMSLAWHRVGSQRLERKHISEAMRRENALLEHQKHLETQKLMNVHDVDLARIELEHAKLELEHKKLVVELRLNRWRVVVPPGHTIVFPADNYATIEAPRTVAHSTTPTGDKAQSVGKMLALAAPRQLPPPFDLLEIFKQNSITSDHMFLGRADGGDPLWVNPRDQLCHGVFHAVTGRGKTIIERGLEAQLLAAGLEVIHMDLKFTLIDENGLDYRPLAKHMLAHPDIEVASGQFLPHLVVDIENIYAMLMWIANVEIPRRLEMYHAGDHSYSVLYAFLEELIYLISKYPDASGLIGDIIVVGRALGIKLFTAAQNFQSQSTNIPGGMSENFETAWFCGGDNFSGAKVLDVKQKDLTDFLTQHHVTLGKSITLLRNNTVAPQARLVRVGMASNEAIYHLLGRADDFRFPGSGTTAGTPGTPAHTRLYGGFGVPQSQATPVIESPQTPRHERMTGDLQQSFDSAAGRLGSIPERSPSWGTDDRQFLAGQEAEFIKLYRAFGNIKECLRRMNGGRGLSNRYNKHAALIVEQRKLRKS